MALSTARNTRVFSRLRWSQQRIKGYDSRWNKARVRFLKTHPLCVRCRAKGMITPATVVDHVTPHRGNQKLFWNEGNWQPLCKSCHDRKTMTEDHNPIYGYDFWWGVGGIKSLWLTSQKTVAPLKRAFSQNVKGVYFWEINNWKTSCNRKLWLVFISFYDLKG